MEILAGLVELVDHDHLPAPWFNRPSLGLLSNTAVWLGVLKSTENSDAPPDIIVTPLQAGIMHYTVSVIVDFDEKPGVVYKALREISTNFNIALAETVTINQRSQHRVTLVLEYPHFLQARNQGQISNAIEKKFYLDLKQLKTKMKGIDGFRGYSDWRVIGQNTNFAKIASSVVIQGLINCSDIREFHRKECRRKNFDNEFNLDAVVVSSSADGRFIRYITPKRGTFEVTVSHKDTPGSLRLVSSALHELGYNILLSRLSRSVGTAPSPGTSTYVAVCEPPKRNTSASNSDTTAIPKEIIEKQIRDEIREKLEPIEAAYELSLKSVTMGTTPKRVAFPYRTGLMPHVREIHAPQEFSHTLYNERLQVKRKKAVFVSYQDPKNQTAEEKDLTSAIHTEIETAGMDVFDGFSKPKGVETPADVFARMWMASAAIFVVRNTVLGMRKPNTPGSRISEVKGLSAAQLMEWGFIYGQGKPWFVICQQGDEANVKSFMFTEKPAITYQDLSKATFSKIREQMAERIAKWNLNSDAPRRS
ncbi:MAG: hypothetical protein ING65_08230 [Rhodocyclaceae bacterium]|nr:hypothetical protein [Rhodocyclaceae bacterium]